MGQVTHALGRSKKGGYWEELLDSTWELGTTFLGTLG